MNKKTWFVALFGSLFIAILMVMIVSRDDAPAPNAGTAGNPSELLWKDLQQLNYRTGEAPAWLRALVGTEVRVPGFVVPLETSAKVREFLLVPNQSYCVHVPAPPPNLMIQVQMAEAVEVKGHSGAVWLTGTLRIESKKNKFGEAAYQIVGRKLEAYVPTR